MSKTSKMHMHVENLEVAKYEMCKVDGDENKLINGRHQINLRRGILVKKELNGRPLKTVSGQEYFQIINNRRSPFIRDSRVHEETQS